MGFFRVKDIPPKRPSFAEVEACQTATSSVLLGQADVPPETPPDDRREETCRIAGANFDGTLRRGEEAQPGCLGCRNQPSTNRVDVQRLKPYVVAEVLIANVPKRGASSRRDAILVSRSP